LSQYRSAALHAHLQKELAEESYLFLRDVAEWRTAAAVTAAEEAASTRVWSLDRAAADGAAEGSPLARARYLASLYIGDGAEQQINVPSAAAKRVQAAVEDPVVAPSLFDECRDEVYTLVTRDVLPRFRTAKGGLEELLETIGAYPGAECFAEANHFDAALEKATGAVPEAVRRKLSLTKEEGALGRPAAKAKPAAGGAKAAKPSAAAATPGEAAAKVQAVVRGNNARNSRRDAEKEEAAKEGEKKAEEEEGWCVIS